MKSIPNQIREKHIDNRYIIIQLTQHMKVAKHDDYLFDDRIITSKSRIKSYEKEFNYNYYIPPKELQSVEHTLNKSLAYTKSAEKIGKQLEEIFIAVYDNDPHKNSKSSIERVHGRIISGRHRYKQSKLSGIRWRVAYLEINSFEEFIYSWLHFGSKKTNAESDLKSKVEQLCDSMFASGNYPDIRKVGASAVKLLSADGLYSRSVLYRYVPRNYINQTISETNRITRTKVKKKSKKDKQIDILEANLEATQKELFSLQDKYKELQQRNKELQNE